MPFPKLMETCLPSSSACKHPRPKPKFRRAAGETMADHDLTSECSDSRLTLPRLWKTVPLANRFPVDPVMRFRLGKSSKREQLMPVLSSDQSTFAIQTM